MKEDISDKKDIKLLVDEFYAKLLLDKRISHFFTDHMTTTLEAHLPTIYSFWESILLDARSYKGNAMLKHIELSRKSKMSTEHFDIWIKWWETMVNAHFEGPNAEMAISRAKSIRSLMEFKVDQ